MTFQALAIYRVLALHSDEGLLLETSTSLSLQSGNLIVIN